MTEKDKPGLVDDALQGLTYQVVGLAMAVHNDLGPGHREATYHNAMTQRYVDPELAAESEPELPIFDEHGNRVNFYRPDHRVADKLLVEYKAHSHPITNDEIAQGLTTSRLQSALCYCSSISAAPASNGSACFRLNKSLPIGGNAGLAPPHRLKQSCRNFRHSFIRSRSAFVDTLSEDGQRINEWRAAYSFIR